MKQTFIIILLIALLIIGLILYIYKDNIRNIYNKTSWKVKEDIAHGAKEIKEDISHGIKKVKEDVKN